MSKTDLEGNFLILFMKKYNTHKDAVVINSLYHTNHVWSNVITLPNTPVNPHKKTAVCNCSKAFRMIKET
jgi:hypothetical protein